MLFRNMAEILGVLTGHTVISISSASQCKQQSINQVLLAEFWAFRGILTVEEAGGLLEKEGKGGWC
jgi:hypothetical protein